MDLPIKGDLVDFASLALGVRQAVSVKALRHYRNGGDIHLAN
ncbi:hypothetical protein [Dyella nitratireducens]|nr:hypothetical protein [Dyella nitratireducens]